jgi:hypothetical protein
MTGNELPNEGPPPAPGNPPSPSNPPSPPLRHRHYVEMMAAIRRLEDRPTSPAPHPLASVSSIDVYLRPGTTQPGAQRFGVNVIQPVPDNGVGALGDLPYWTAWFRGISSERGDASFAVMQQGWEAANAEAASAETARQNVEENEAPLTRAEQEAATVARRRADLAAARVENNTDQQAAKQKPGEDEAAKARAAKDQAVNTLLGGIPEEDGDSQPGENHEQIAPSGSGGERKTGESGGDENGSWAGDRSQTSNNDKPTGNKPTGNKSTGNKSTGNKSTVKKSTVKKSAGEQPGGGDPSDEGSSDDSSNKADRGSNDKESDDEDSSDEEPSDDKPNNQKQRNGQLETVSEEENLESPSPSPPRKPAQKTKRTTSATQDRPEDDDDSAFSAGSDSDLAAPAAKKKAKNETTTKKSPVENAAAKKNATDKPDSGNKESNTKKPGDNGLRNKAGGDGEDPDGKEAAYDAMLHDLQSKYELARGGGSNQQQKNRAPASKTSPAPEDEGYWDSDLFHPPSPSPPRERAQKTKRTTSKQSSAKRQPGDDEGSAYSASSDDNVVRSSSESDGDGESDQQQKGRATASKSKQKPAATVSKPPAKQKTPATAQPPAQARTTAHASTPNPAGPMAPPPPPQRPPPPRQSTSTPKDPKAGQKKPRAASEQLAATPSSARTPRPNRASSFAPPSNRSTRSSSVNAIDTVPEEADPPGVERTIWLDSKGRPVPGCDRLEGDILPAISIENSDPERIFRENNRIQRELKAARKSAASKRTASVADADAESPSERPAKKAKPTVQADGPASRLLSVIESVESLADEESDAHGDDESADPEVVDGAAVESQDENSEGSRRQVYSGLTMNDLAEREGVQVTYRDLLEELARGFGGDEVYDDDFRWAVDGLVDEGTVQSEGEGEGQLLWIGVDSPGADGDEDEGKGNDDSNNVNKRHDDKRDSTGEDSSDSSSEDEENDNDSGMQLSRRELNDKVRREGLERAILDDLGRHGTGDVNVNVLKKRLERNPHGEEVIAEEFSSAIEKLEELGQLRSSGAGPKRRVRLGAAAIPTGGSAAADGNGGDDDKNTGGNGNGKSSGSSNDDNSFARWRKGLTDDVRDVLRTYGRIGVTYADLLVRLTGIYAGIEVVTPEYFRRVIQGMVMEGGVQQHGLGPTRTLILATGAAPTGGSTAADGDDGDDDNTTSGNSNDDNDFAKIDGLEARNRDEAHRMRPRSRVEKPGNSRQPNRSIVDRNEDETSWVSDVGEERGSSQQRQQPEASPSKLTRKRKAKTEDPASAEEDSLLSPLSPDARNANFDPDDEDDDQPPTKKAKQSAQKKLARSKE